MTKQLEYNMRMIWKNPLIFLQKKILVSLVFKTTTGCLIDIGFQLRLVISIDSDLR